MTSNPGNRLSVLEVDFSITMYDLEGFEERAERSENIPEKEGTRSPEG